LPTGQRLRPAVPTLAVLANGVDTIYPATHKSLADDIIKHDGAIISEYEPGTLAQQYQFLERNRIVSGLSDAVIVTEAAIRSGTLSTVTHALEQGREVFVVPGNITSPLSAGCNALIKQGAHPITCAQDVLEIVAPDLLKPQQMLPPWQHAAGINHYRLDTIWYSRRRSITAAGRSERQRIFANADHDGDYWYRPRPRRQSVDITIVYVIIILMRRV